MTSLNDELGFYYQALEESWNRKELELGRDYATIGVIRPRNVFFCDIDSTKGIDIYKTKDGFHLVSQLSHSFDYHFRRLRIGAKYDAKGRVVNPAPKLLFCGCPNRRHHDKRMKGTLELYVTASK